MELLLIIVKLEEPFVLISPRYSLTICLKPCRQVAGNAYVFCRKHLSFIQLNNCPRLFLCLTPPAFVSAFLCLITGTIHCRAIWQNTPLSFHYVFPQMTIKPVLINHLPKNQILQISRVHLKIPFIDPKKKKSFSTSNLKLSANTILKFCGIIRTARGGSSAHLTYSSNFVISFWWVPLCCVARQIINFQCTHISIDNRQ